MLADWRHSVFISQVLSGCRGRVLLGEVSLGISFWMSLGYRTIVSFVVFQRSVALNLFSDVPLAIKSAGSVEIHKLFTAPVWKDRALTQNHKPDKPGKQRL